MGVDKLRSDYLAKLDSDTMTGVHAILSLEMKARADNFFLRAEGKGYLQNPSNGNRHRCYLSADIVSWLAVALFSMLTHGPELSSRPTSCKQIAESSLAL